MIFIGIAQSSAASPSPSQRKMYCNELTKEDVRANPHILEGVVRQLSQLLKTGLTHCDVRFPNICLHEGFTRLLDLESIVEQPPSRLDFPNVIEFTYPRGRADPGGTALWQLALILHRSSQLVNNKPRKLDEFQSWLDSNRHIPICPGLSSKCRSQAIRLHSRVYCNCAVQFAKRPRLKRQRSVGVRSSD